MRKNGAKPLTIALSKGRILEDTLPMLAAAGLLPEEDLSRTRKLMVTVAGGVRLLIIRAADVCTYVERGAADLGIVGRDLLLEHQPHLLEPLDLHIGCCRLCVASPKDKPFQLQRGQVIRVATKYDRLAEQYFAKQGVQADIIHLYGSMELAPLIEMADCIVDVVSTGNTLKANQLIEREHLYDISSRLVANPASMATRRDELLKLIQQFRQAIPTGEPI